MQSNVTLKITLAHSLLDEAMTNYRGFVVALRTLVTSIFHTLRLSGSKDGPNCSADFGQQEVDFVLFIRTALSTRASRGGLS